jgi:signal transduction histidine kinase
MASVFPSISQNNNAFEFSSGELVKLPKEYFGKDHNDLISFYIEITGNNAESLIWGSDPLGFDYIYYRGVCNVGLLFLPKKKGKDRDLVKKYPDNKFNLDFVQGIVKKEHSLQNFEEYIPIDIVKHNLHELRNLNFNIISRADALINASSDENWEAAFDYADEDIKKIFVAARITKFILDSFSFYTPDAIENLRNDQRSSFSIHRSLSKIVKIFSNDSKKIRGRIDFKGSCNKYIRGDKAHFEVALMLLIENAWKYSTDPAKLCPRVTIESQYGKVLISISSYGVIIPIEEQGSLFTRGFRSKSVSPNKEGTGIGLYNAKKLFGLFDGEIKYSYMSSAEGSTLGWNQFNICIPVEETDSINLQFL